eukprot:PhF_6_TR42773/c0_g1_i2/m.64701
MKSVREDLDSFDPKSKRVKANPAPSQLLAFGTLANAPSTSPNTPNPSSLTYSATPMLSGSLGSVVYEDQQQQQAMAMMAAGMPGGYGQPPGGSPMGGLGYAAPTQTYADPRHGRVMCRNMASTGSCPFGARCTFRHTEDVPNSEGVNTSGSDRPLCRNYSQGHCPRGEHCGFRHGDPAAAIPTAPSPVTSNLSMTSPLNSNGTDDLAITPCPNYSQYGQCSAFPNCPYLHPPPPSSNHPSGSSGGMPSLYGAPQGGGSATLGSARASTTMTMTGRLKKSIPCKNLQSGSCPF